MNADGRKEKEDDGKMGDGRSNYAERGSGCSLGGA
jgi:hypothetical protein